MNSKVSVITVVYNAVKSLEKTILSVLNQSYENVEYIIIDGGSTDGSVEIIKKYAHRLAYWVSEPDQGVYDAMNKGIRKAAGEWINFMNAGDTFWERDTVKNIFTAKIFPETDVIYGDTCTNAYGFFFWSQAAPLTEFQRKLPFCHQSSFVRLGIMQKSLFNVRYKISADYDFFYRLYNQKAKFDYVSRIICIFEFGGLSSQYYEKAIQESNEINGGRILLSKTCLINLKIKLFILRNFPLFYHIIKKIQFVLFPWLSYKKGWKNIKFYNDKITDRKR